MDSPGGFGVWWARLSRARRAAVSWLLLLPLVELTFWGLVYLLGGQQGGMVIAGIAGASSAAVLGCSSNEVLAHPEIGDKFARQHPVLARAICWLGFFVCLTLATAFAFGRQLGLPGL